MNKEAGEIIKITSHKVLLSLFDLALPFFGASSVYRVSARQLRDQHEDEQIELQERIKYLRKSGLIQSFIKQKEKYLEITPKGLQKISALNIDSLKINKPERWDGKWRIVIFDIPERHKSAREILRLKLKDLGFEKIQDSVYVHPFECSSEISKLTAALSEKGNILIMISEIIQGEEDLIRRFWTKGLLSKEDLRG